MYANMSAKSSVRTSMLQMSDDQTFFVLSVISFVYQTFSYGGKDSDMQKVETTESLVAEIFSDCRRMKAVILIDS